MKQSKQQEPVSPLKSTRTVAFRIGVVAAVIILPLVIMLCAPGSGTAAEPTEYEVKAAFLFNFAKFVEWPSSAFQNQNSPFIIAVVGTDPFGNALDRTVQGKEASGHRIQTKRFKRVGDVAQCHILFVSSSEQSKLSSVLDRVAGKSVLTVSDLPKFAHQGGTVGFTASGKKIGLEINPKNAEKAKLKISSKLLSIANIINK